MVEWNASDTRNKKTIESLVTTMSLNTSIEFFQRKAQLGSEAMQTSSKKSVIIMDEVDGIGGNNDRGGIAALIGIIKTTKTPVICICNDRQNRKLTSLAGHCYDLKFTRYSFFRMIQSGL